LSISGTVRDPSGLPSGVFVTLRDPAGAAKQATTDNGGVERWLYNGLHTLDFSFWYNKRPLSDIGMIVLLLGGLASTSMGVVLAIKRLRRTVAVQPRQYTPASTVPARPMREETITADRLISDAVFDRDHYGAGAEGPG
jgi:hypothetical protein